MSKKSSTFIRERKACVLEGNPYIVRAAKARRRFRPEVIGGRPVEVIDQNTGEVTVGTQLIGRQKLYDSTEFIKFYDPRVLIGLSIPAVAMLSYVISRLRFGGVVIIDYEDASQYTGYTSRQSLWRGLHELIEKDVMRLREKNEYWVNPNIVYRGQRDEFETDSGVEQR